MIELECVPKKMLEETEKVKTLVQEAQKRRQSCFRRISGK